VLDYHLGDVSDGTTPGQGEQHRQHGGCLAPRARYGASGSSLAPYAYLDVAPTTNKTTNARPTPDGVVDFEDLIMFALNYAPKVSGPAHAVPLASIPAGEAIDVQTPVVVEAGQTFEVPMTLTAGGSLQGLSVALDWDSLGRRARGHGCGCVRLGSGRHRACRPRPVASMPRCSVSGRRVSSARAVSRRSASASSRTARRTSS
jgi:hypothetical protein